MTNKEWILYIAAWQERRRRASEALDLRVETGRTTARECAQVLIERFGARRGWLFGSLAHRDSAHTRSDIDLAGEGLPPEEYFPALAAIWDLLPPSFGLDLVPLEDARPSLAGLVWREGKLLYERT